MGTFLSVPAELARGKVLYRDISSWYGPVGPYFYALVLRLCGPNLLSFYLAGVVLAGAALGTVYALARRLLPPWQAAVAGLRFLCLIFATLTENFFVAYSAAGPPATLLGLLLVLALLAAVERTRLGYWLWGGFLLGLCVISKHEFAAAALAVAVIAWLQARKWRAWAVLWGTGLLIPALLLAWFLGRVPWRVLFLENIFPTKVLAYYGGIKESYFFGNLKIAAIRTELVHDLVVAGFVVLVLAAAWLWSRSWRIALAILGVAAVAVYGSPLRAPAFAVASGARLLPTIFTPMLFVAPIGLVLVARNFFRPQAAAPIVVLTYASVIGIHQSAFTAVVPTIAGVWLLLQVLPGVLARRDARWAQAYKALMTVVLAYGAVATFHHYYGLLYREKNSPVTGSAGTFYDYPERAAVFRELLAEIERHPGEPVVCGTEGAWVNFLLRRPVPIRHTQWWPYTEERVLEDLAALSPPRIYILNYTDADQLGRLHLNGTRQFLETRYRHVRRIVPHQRPASVLRAASADIYERK